MTFFKLEHVGGNVRQLEVTAGKVTQGGVLQVTDTTDRSTCLQFRRPHSRRERNYPSNAIIMVAQTTLRHAVCR